MTTNTHDDGLIHFEDGTPPMTPKEATYFVLTGQLPSKTGVSEAKVKMSDGAVMEVKFEVSEEA